MSGLDRIIVYTCITGNYDNLIELTKKEKNIDYICFTNNKNLTSNTWNIKYLNEDIDNWTLARKVKVLSYKYLPKHDISIWLDGAINVLKPVSEFIDKECELDKYDMVGFKHKFRDCIYDEISACVDMRKETIENAKKLESFLIKENYPKHNGLIESCVLVRKNNDKVNKLMDKWFSIITNYTRRDQLSFNYCLWKNPVDIKMLNMWAFNNKYFKHIGHVKREVIDYRLIFDDKQQFDYHDAVDSSCEIVNNTVSIKTNCIRNTNKIVLQMPNVVGSTISSIKINNSSKGVNIFNYKKINGKILFIDNPIILFEGSFKKNQNINISFNITLYNKTEIIKHIGSIIEKEIDKKNKLKNEYDVLYKSYQNIINSKSWKIIEKTRKVIKK